MKALKAITTYGTMRQLAALEDTIGENAWWRIREHLLTLRASAIGIITARRPVAMLDQNVGLAAANAVRARAAAHWLRQGKIAEARGSMAMIISNTRELIINLKWIADDYRIQARMPVPKSLQYALNGIEDIDPKQKKLQEIIIRSAMS